MALSNETIHILRRLLPRRAVDVLAAEFASAGGTLSLDDGARGSAVSLKHVVTFDDSTGDYIELLNGLDPDGFSQFGGFGLRIGTWNLAYPKFSIGPDGDVGWADGTTPPDVKLERDAASDLKFSSPDVAPGVATYLGFATDDGWLGVESVAPGLTLSSYMGPGYYQAQTTQEFADADNDPVFISRFGAGGELDFFIRRKGDICWGDHLGVSDAILKRESAGSLELVPFSGASDIVLHSPDGTRYRVAVANGGTLSAVAA